MKSETVFVTNAYEALAEGLPNSTAAERAVWAKWLVEHSIDISELLGLLKTNNRMGLRFLWLLGEMVDIYPKALLPILQALYQLKQELPDLDMSPSLAKFWQLCGIPKGQESQAIDQLFGWLGSSDSNVSLKTRSLFALKRQAKLYPELRVEIKVHCEEQLGKNTVAFDKLLRKELEEMLKNSLK